MAEKALYDNLSEPHFPFDVVRPTLDWLAPYLAQNEPSLDDFNPK